MGPAGHRISELNLTELPAAPGVYLFQGEGGPQALPIYIGKSINIRARVLSHLREPDEARMMAQVHQVEWIRTAGEIGALLLESRLIKQRQPLHNVRLRRARDLCSWQLDLGAGATRPSLVYSRDIEFAQAPALYGLYTSAHRAKHHLLGLAQEHRLCLMTLGLEAVSRRGCFGLQIGRCAGACVGQESTQQHTERLLALLQTEAVERWPFDGPVGLVERDGDWVQTHVVQDWRHLRTEDSRQAGQTVQDRPTGFDHPPRAVGTGFDLDAYRILMRPLLSGAHEVVALQQPSP